MRWHLHINHKVALDFGMNITQAHIFDLLCGCASWAKTVVVDDVIYYWVARQVVCNELKILNLKPDTVYRHLKKLHRLGVIIHVKKGQKDCIKITEKGALYYAGNESELDDFTMSDLNPKNDETKPKNSDLNPKNDETKPKNSDLNPKNDENSDLNPKNNQNSDLNPKKLGFKSEKGAKNSDLNPTYPLTNNPITKSNIYINPLAFNQFYESYPKKISRSAAERQWLKLSDDDRLDAAKNVTRRYLKTPYKFIHSPENYLRDKLWRDELNTADDKQLSADNAQGDEIDYGSSKRGFLDHG